MITWGVRVAQLDFRIRVNLFLNAISRVNVHCYLISDNSVYEQCVWQVRQICIVRTYV